MNVRIAEKKRDFVMINNALLADSSISFQAKGIICYLLSKTDNWKAIASQLASLGPDGMGVVRSAMNELVKAGYARRIRVLDDQTKRVIAWEFVVFENKSAGAQFHDGQKVSWSTLQKVACGSEDSTLQKRDTTFSTTTKLQTTEDCSPRKIGETKEMDSSLREESAPANAGDEGGGTGIDADEIEHFRKTESDSAQVAEPMLLRSEDDEPNGKDFPWRRIMGAMKRIVPELELPTKGDRRDMAMKQWWKANGKTIGAFEELAKRVQESDFLMGRGGHKGRGGRPYPWSWIFSKDEGSLRAAKVMDGFYDNERMAFVLEKQATEKLTKVMLSISTTPIAVNLSEMWQGEPRYRVTGVHSNGCQEVIDYKD